MYITARTGFSTPSAVLASAGGRAHNRDMRRWLVALLVAVAVAAGCGDTAFIFVFNSGIILADPSCRGATGQFQLQNQDGLVLLVVITSSTRIVLASGRPGTCADLVADTRVGVDGTQSGDRVSARSVTVQ
jgi:hypothetical protein